jgi:hypothetical protein
MTRQYSLDYQPAGIQTLGGALKAEFGSSFQAVLRGNTVRVFRGHTTRKEKVLVVPEGVRFRLNDSTLLSSSTQTAMTNHAPTLLSTYNAKLAFWATDATLSKVPKPIRILGDS